MQRDDRLFFSGVFFTVPHESQNEIDESLMSLKVVVPPIRQLSTVFEPGHGGNEGRVVFDFTLEHSAHSSLHHLVLWLPQDAGGLWMIGNKEFILGIITA